jgi:endonuclease YncB( thermonuclease family)
VEAFEWTPGVIIFAMLLVFWELVVLGPRVVHKARDPFTGRVKPGRVLMFGLGLIVSFFGAMAIFTTLAQSSRMTNLSVKFVDALDSVTVLAQSDSAGKTVTIRLLGVSRFEEDPNGEAIAFLRSKVKTGDHITIKLPKSMPLESGTTEAYVFTGDFMGDELGVILIKAGMARRNTQAKHQIVTIKSLHKSYEETARREKNGLWRLTEQKKVATP